MDVTTKLNIEEIKENKKENNIFSNPVHGSLGQDKQLKEIQENNKILNEFINDIFYYFWGFFDKSK
jgi:hypothetical protein